MARKTKAQIARDAMIDRLHGKCIDCGQPRTDQLAKRCEACVAKLAAQAAALEELRPRGLPPAPEDDAHPADRSGRAPRDHEARQVGEDNPADGKAAHLSRSLRCAIEARDVALAERDSAIEERDERFTQEEVDEKTGKLQKELETSQNDGEEKEKECEDLYKQLEEVKANPNDITLLAEWIFRMGGTFGDLCGIVKSDASIAAIQLAYARASMEIPS